MSDDADIIARAIDRVLEQVPGAIDTALPEAASKLQPWAETAAPPSGTAKRPLEDLLAELAASVAADPGAMATLPGRRHPALAFFDRFTRPARGEGDGRSSRRRRRRRGGAAAEPAAAPAVSGEPRSGRRRRRRGRGGGTQAGGGTAAASAPAQAQPGANRPSGSGRRRRGRRGRGGGGGGQRPAES